MLIYNYNIKIYYNYKMEQDYINILQPFTYLNNNSGKNIRTKMINAFDIWLNIPVDKKKIINIIINDLHTSSLLIDDIEDNSIMRRGKTCSHLVYGIPLTINAANYVWFLALKKCKQLNNNKVFNICIEEIINLHNGQGKDILWRDTLKCPTKKEYIVMIKEKTGGLFRLAFRLMQLFSECNKNYTLLLNKLAIYFQIRDDYMNLASKAYHDNKSFCEDLTEGKFSYPIIHAINKNPKNFLLLNILKQKTNDIKIKKNALKYLIDIGSIKHTYLYLNKLKKELDEMVENNIQLKKIIDKLHETIPHYKIDIKFK